MRSVALFAILFLIQLIMIALNVKEALNTHSWTRVIANIPGTLGLLTTLCLAISRQWFSVYLWFRRWQLRLFDRGVLTRWKFFARFEGCEAEDALDRAISAILSIERLKPTLETKKNRSALIGLLGGPILLEVSIDREPFQNDGFVRINVQSRTIEVTYAAVQNRLSTVIEPLLRALKEGLRPKSDSYEAEIEFPKGNPFYALYLAHFRPDEIDDFSVRLNVADYSTSGRPDRVEISKENVRIVAESGSSFMHLAADFISLSPRSETLLGKAS